MLLSEVVSESDSLRGIQIYSCTRNAQSLSKETFPIKQHSHKSS